MKHEGRDALTKNARTQNPIINDNVRYFFDTVRSRVLSYAFILLLNAALNLARVLLTHDLRRFISCSRVRINAHSDGVKVKATKPERIIPDAIVIEN